MQPSQNTSSNSLVVQPTFDESTTIVDQGTNGLFVAVRDDGVVLELRHKNRLQNWEYVFKSSNPAERQFVAMLARLICAGITAGVSAAVIQAVSVRIGETIRELGVVTESNHRDLRVFRETPSPDYEYESFDSVINGIVAGTYGLFAEIHPVRNASAN